MSKSRYFQSHLRIKAEREREAQGVKKHVKNLGRHWTRPTTPALERFMAKVRIEAGGCWEWLGYCDKNGYGQFMVDNRRKSRRRIGPYRFIWEYCHGPMPEGLEPDHTCNNRSCVNPAHIEAVTHAENMRRSFERGRPPRKPVEPSTHCKHGHEFTPENSKITTQGVRVCRTCTRRHSRENQQRRKARVNLT